MRTKSFTQQAPVTYTIFSCSIYLNFDYLLVHESVER